LLRKAHDSLEERVEERTFELVAANDQLQQELNRREAAEEALAEQNRIMTVLLDNLQVGVFMVEASSGKPLLANRSAIELLGRGIINGSYKDNYAEIFKAYKLGTNEYYPVEQMPIYLGLKGRSHTVDDMVVVHPDGNKVFLEVFGSPVLDQQGKVIASLVSFSDITGRKRAEQERERLQVQIQQAQKMESIGTLAGGIAHNFNNLLMGIQGRTSLMMLETDRFHPSFEHLQEIEICIQKAAKLTKQLLGFARGGKYEIKPTALNDLVENSAQMFGRTKKEITIFKKYEENLWPAAVDQSQIDQVLLNIFVNAWQAMPEGGDLYIQTKNEILDDNFVRAYGVAPGKYIKISIMDTGIGMDEKTMKRVFDPFFTTKEKGRGTGFGLASAYGIIKNHDGIITVESAKDEGATFHVYLPASEKTIIEKEGYEQKISVGSETILLVDDEAMIIDVSVQMLNKMGYKVLTAHNGREAIDIFKQNYDKVGIVILDMIMPGMGGGEVYERLKEIDTNVKVLLSSGYSINGQAAEILNRGCDGFIQKPFKLNELSYKLREIISKQKVKG
jgi:signal transduction histidine kinase/ActR/RegA family two-component response regulator